MMNTRESSKLGIEIWRPVVGHEDRYQVSNLGNVRSRRGILNPGIDKHGYRRVAFWCSGTKRQYSHLVHALELLAFDGPKLTGQVCRHLDGVPGHDVLHNLCWGSHSENRQDSKRHGTFSPPPVHVQAGENNNSAKLAEEQVLYIRKTKESAKSLAKRFGVTQWTIFDIRKGRSWAATE